MDICPRGRMLYKVLIYIAKIDNETERTATATELLGRYANNIEVRASIQRIGKGLQE